ncbi:MAG: flavin reductase family protein [Rhodobacterales bacterium]|nr:flavin reductase family protein [Rhodobacterales bacterium]
MTDILDPRQLRNALGRFATGITIITTVDDGGHPVGLTANSFSTVSLDPPLVLWSLSGTAPSAPAFNACGHFAVNVLAADQKAVSDRFARPGDKFAGLAWTPGAGGAPLLPGCLARFQCRAATRHAGGDHTIHIGQVLSFDYGDGDPLLYYAGRYGIAHPHPDAA